MPFVATALLLLPPAVAAPIWADDAPLTTPAQVLLDAAKADPPADADDPVHILYEDVHVVVSEDRTVTRSSRMIYELRDPSAAPYWTRVDAGWTPWYQDRPAIAARVIRPDGSVFTLDPSTAVDEAARDMDPTLLDDHRILHAPLPQVAKGAIVEVVITDRPKAPFGPGGAAVREQIADGPYAHAERIVVEAPAKSPLRWTSLDATATATTTKKNGVQRLQLDVDPISDKLDPEPWALSTTLGYRMLEVSTGASWEAESASYHALVADKLSGTTLGPLLEAGKGKDGIAKIEALLAAVRKRVRYTGVEFGEAAIIPASPDEVLARGWGDCKEQASLLVALLNASGIPAEVALIRPGNHEDVSPDHPSLALFSHAIVHVPGPLELWIDPSVPQVGARETPMEEIGHHALVIRAKGGALLEVPAPTPEHNFASAESELKLVPGAPLPMDVHMRAEGVVARALRPEWGQDGTVAMRERFEKMVDSTDGAIDRLDIAGVDRTDVPFDVHVTGHFGRPLYDQWVDSMQLSQVIVLPEPIVKDEIPEDRTAPFGLVPARLEQVQRVVVPEGYVLADAPQPLHFASQGVTIDVTRASLPGGVEEIRMVGVVTPARMEVAQARELAKAIAPVFAAWEPKLRVVASGVLAVEKHHTIEGVREARARIAAHPEQPAWHVQLSGILERGGFPQEALVELEAARALVPNDLDLLLRKLDLVSLDPLARDKTPPFDARAWRTTAKACLDQDPTQESCKQAYGASLVLDDEGRMFGPGAPLTELDTWMTGQGDKAPSSLRNLQVQGLLRLGRYADAKKLAAKGFGDGPETALVIVATALADGPAAGAGQITRMNEGSRKYVATQVVNDLLAMRKYPEAAAIARAALGKSTDKDKIKELEGYEKTKRWEDRLTELGEPTSVALHFVHDVSVGLPREKLTTLASPELLAQLEPASGERGWYGSIRGMMVGWFGGTSPGVTDTDRELDTILGAGTVSVEGDEHLGWRVTLRDADWRRPVRLFLVKGRKGPEVRGIAMLDNTVGAEALRRARAGDTAGAARWLDWWQEDEPAGEDALPAARYRTVGDTDKARLQVAAAMLCPPSDEDANKVMEAAFATETGDRRLHLGRRLLGTLGVTKQWGRAQPVLDALLAEHPDELDLLKLKIEVAFAKGDLPGAKAAVTAALARNARDPGLLVEAVEIGQAAGDAQPAIDALLRAADAGETQGTVLNDAAWALLFVPGHEAQALTLAERAAAMKDTGDGTRHTLALAQLANGRPDDALATLQDAARRHGDVRYLAEYWWLIRGGLAEAYGLPDAAIAAYEKVPEEEGGFRFRSDVWAKTRLEALRATSGAQ